MFGPSSLRACIEAPPKAGVAIAQALDLTIERRSLLGCREVPGQCRKHGPAQARAAYQEKIQADQEHDGHRDQARPPRHLLILPFHPLHLPRTRCYSIILQIGRRLPIPAFPRHESTQLPGPTGAMRRVAYSVFSSDSSPMARILRHIRFTIACSTSRNAGSCARLWRSWGSLPR